MKNVQAGLLASVIAGLVAGQIAIAQRAPTTPPRSTGAQAPMQTKVDTQSVFNDIEQTVGFVPQFFREVPATLLPVFWNSMKNFEMNDNTALDAKTKQLIGIAVAAQIPCEYCLAFHKESAKMHGATAQEIKEAVGMASVTRMGSTLLNGLQIDRQQFRKDLQRITRNGNNKKNTQASRSR